MFEESMIALPDMQPEAGEAPKAKRLDARIRPSMLARLDALDPRVEHSTGGRCGHVGARWSTWRSKHYLFVSRQCQSEYRPESTPLKFQPWRASASLLLPPLLIEVRRCGSGSVACAISGTSRLGTRVHPGPSHILVLRILESREYGYTRALGKPGARVAPRPGQTRDSGIPGTQMYPGARVHRGPR